MKDLKIYIHPEAWTSKIIPIEGIIIKDTPKKLIIKSTYYKTNFSKEDIGKVIFFDRDKCLLSIADYYNSKIQSNFADIQRYKKILEELQ